MCCVFRGYAFIEFDTNEAANDATRAMNLFEFGGLHLRVGRVGIRSVTCTVVAELVNFSLLKLSLCAFVCFCATCSSGVVWLQIVI